jgi:DNA-directed RNA polymerase subunit N (RpoN/RPB10)
MSNGSEARVTHQYQEEEILGQIGLNRYGSLDYFCRR